jgi:predicted Zn-dependent protease
MFYVSCKCVHYLPEQKQQFDELVYSYSVKQAESLLQIGKPKDAVRILVDLQTQRPTDSTCNDCAE